MIPTPMTVSRPPRIKLRCSLSPNSNTPAMTPNRGTSKVKGMAVFTS